MVTNMFLNIFHSVLCMQVWTQDLAPVIPDMIFQSYTGNICDLSIVYF